MKMRILVLMAATLLVAVACSAGAGSPAPADPTAAKADAAWRTATLVDTRTGESFSVDGLRGKLVAIEVMAAWCSNCKIQQLEAATALSRLNDPNIVYISVDVDPHEGAKDLADYAERSGFDWRFVVATTEVARSLAATFGDQVLSPPSTPIILVGPDGTVVDQHFGIRGADDLIKLFSEHLS